MRMLSACEHGTGAEHSTIYPEERRVFYESHYEELAVSRRQL